MGKSWQRAKATEGQILQEGEFSRWVASDGRRIAGICFASAGTLQPPEYAQNQLCWEHSCE